ncbi:MULTISPECIES: CotH kinase family protein [unclassified Prevotella]|uniref:CotH kinase family protein n=1 Tax=unclassified Prevotella TaxID=2638335 RepID=UPI00048FA5E4|nr:MULTISPECIES: CotH kinase family protein [unclassified Prevotella]
MTNKFIFALFLLTSYQSTAHADGKLSGTVIGTLEAVNYQTGQKSTTVNTRENAFDGDLSTFFASWDRSYTWTGLDLGSPHVITRVGWSPRNDGLGEGRVVLGVFEGANREDFMDALPIYLISEKGTIGTMSYADVNCSRGFRYVRYIGPSDARCNIAELEFYGTPGEGDDSHLYQVTNLPTVSIHTLNGEIPYDKEHQITSQLTIISEDGTHLLSEPGTTKERGNASRQFPKKPYRIKFDKKQNVLDAPAKAKKWTLINNYGDKTLMRNLLAFELSRRMGLSYTPYGTAVDVLLNGEYKGCYQLCDQIEVNKNRVNITDDSYLIEVDAYAYDEPVYFVSNQNNPVTIKSPDEETITAEQVTDIKNFFNKMENQWKEYLDLNSFLRHFLVGELSGNTDTYWSVYMYKPADEEMLYTGPVWDFDLAFNNDNRTYPITSNRSDYIYRSGGSCAGNMKQFVDKIVVNDTYSKQQLTALWGEARQRGLTEESMVAYIDSLEQALDQSQKLNFLRWPIMNEYVHQNPHIWGSYTAEVENVRQYMQQRIGWMDRKLNYTHQSSGITDVPLDTTKSYQVYTLAGQPCGNSLDALSPGIYIVRQGQTTKKVIVSPY